MKHYRTKSALLTVITTANILLLTGCGRTPLDPFEKLTVEFEGVSGYSGTANVDNRQCETYLAYFCSPYDVLSNGDTIKITVTTGDKLLKKNKVKLTATEKEYVVEGLSEFPSELTEEEADQLTSVLGEMMSDYTPRGMLNVGDQLRLSDIQNNEIHEKLSYGNWICEDVSDKEIDFRSYDIWDYSEGYSFENNESRTINAFTAVWRVDITVKCSKISDYSRSLCERNGGTLPNIGDTFTYSLYMTNYLSGICRNTDGLTEEAIFGYSTWRNTGTSCRFSAYTRDEALQAVQADYTEFSDSKLLKSIEY